MAMSFVGPMLLSLFRSNKFETFDAGIAPDRFIRFICGHYNSSSE